VSELFYRSSSCSLFACSELDEAKRQADELRKQHEAEQAELKALQDSLKKEVRLLASPASPLLVVLTNSVSSGSRRGARCAQAAARVSEAQGLLLPLCLPRRAE
jgi:hypothetical protein